MKKFSEVRDKFIFSKNPQKPKLKIIKGKDGKKGLKINGKLVLSVEYDYIGATDYHVFFEQYGVARMATIEELLERYVPTN